MDWKTRYISKVAINKKANRKGGKLVLRRDYSVCWNWTGGKSSKGYGGFWRDGRGHSATRIGWEFWHGSPPPIDEMICHTCDHPWCHNPRHWFLGTGSDNAIDKVNKGRGKTPNGSKQWKSKLTENDVLAIRVEHTGEYGENARLGRKYGVARETVRGIVNGKEWHHLL